MAIGTGTIQSLRRGLHVLETVAMSGLPLTAHQIAQATELALPTTYHLLKTLEEADYIRRSSGTYSATAKLGMLQSAIEAHMGPDGLTLDVMRELRTQTGETAYTSRWLSSDATVEGVAEAHQAVRVAGIYVGLRGNAYARASGRVLLASGVTDLEAYLRATDFLSLTPRTLVDPERLRAEINLVRATGYAIDIAEFTEGVCCISMPFVGSDGVTRALTISVPETRFDARRDDLLTSMTATVVKAGLSSTAPSGRARTHRLRHARGEENAHQPVRHAAF